MEIERFINDKPFIFKKVDIHRKVHMILKRIFTIIKYRLWLFRGWILKNKKKFVMGTMACALVIGIVGWIFFRTYHNYEVVNEIKRKSDTSANYYFDEDGMLCYSKDGVSFTNNKGEVLWDQVFGMESPKMHECGEYFVIEILEQIVSIFLIVMVWKESLVWKSRFKTYVSVNKE